jgi:glycosyltransferase involved in cell wall biosynthesis
MKTVVAHCGARDAYQVAAALAEGGMLDSLVTDLYWPADRWWAGMFERLLPGAAGARYLRMRYDAALASRNVKQCALSGAWAFAMRKSAVPFSWKRWAIRRADANVGSRAGRLASTTGSALLSYSYYGYAAFTEAAAKTPKILFQLHPHPVSVRRILKHELELFPECAASLLKEWELALPVEDFEKLVAETRMAEQWIAASSFTRSTLIENGVPSDRIHVAPYGTNLERFEPKHGSEYRTGGPLKLLFVGVINQRKGIRYLLDALALLKTRQVELLVCGRVVDDLSIFRPYADRVTVRPSVSARELLAAYHAADLFVFPSLAEGFGHVLLESMASGLPVLSTTRTAAVDLIEPEVEGFIVEPGRADLLAEHIEWALDHRMDLAGMGRAARVKAETFTWARFRARTREILEQVWRNEPTSATGSVPGV